jgi:hypothetical protein
MTRTLCTITLMIIAGIANAQSTVKVSAFYPVAKEFKVKNAGVDTRYIYQSNGCVEGDCKKGEGTFVVVCDDVNMQGEKEKGFVTVNIYKGTFREDGKYFEGKMYQWRPDYIYTTSYNTAVLTPVNPVDISRDENLKGSLIGEGTMTRSSECKTYYAQYGLYYWAGWRHNDVENPQAGKAKSYDVYFDITGTRIAQKVVFTPGNAYKEFVGRSIYYDEIVGGRFLYEDNSTYEGFVFRGKLFGPGILTTPTGEKKQGIWMLDTLAMPMDIKFPNALFDPSVEHDPGYPQYKFHQIINKGGPTFHRYYTGADGWVLGVNTEEIIFGKTKDMSFEGPGIYVKFKDREYKYYTGTFSEGWLKEGMRIQYNVVKNEPYTSIVSGKFYENKLVAGCNREITLDHTGKPYLILEGMFYPSDNSPDELLTGWVYFNDWAGLREEKNLAYWYADRDVFSPSFSKDLYIDAAKRANSARFCFPKTVTQRDAILKKLTAKADSMLIVKRVADAERERLAELRREAVAKTTACMQKLDKNKIALGITVTDGRFVGYVSDVNCDDETVTIVDPGDQIFYRPVEKRTVSMYDFVQWRRHPKQFRTCSRCNGTCGETQTHTTSKTKELPFGYFSGITTTITKTKTETTWVKCNQCKGTGVSLE